MKDSLGDRMKEQYENRTRYFLPRRTYTIIRLDGKAFHTLTKNLDKPFDRNLMNIMDQVASYLCDNIQGASFAYVQSDEISILLTDFTNPTTDAWFNGNIQKIVSVSASMATAKFNELANFDAKFKNKIALFDSRIFTIPDPVEVENYFIWRQNDATRNSIQMAARSVYSHKECHGKNGSQLQDMLHEKGINWNDYSSREKRGGLTTDGLIYEAFRFTQDRDSFKQLIPRIGE